MKLTLPVFALLAAFSVAQVQVTEVSIASKSLGPAGDHDGDGVGDYYLGTAIYSGADHSQLADAKATVPGAVATTVLNDWNGDAIPDFVVAHGVFFTVVSGGPGGGILAQHTFAEPVIDVTNAGDLNGDGLDDVLAHGGGAFCAGSGLGVLESGAALPSVFYGGGYSAYWGAAGVGDLDGDGDDEFAVVYGNYGQIDLDAYDDGSTFFGSLPTAQNADPYLTHLIARLGDLDDDGRDDLIVASQGDVQHTRVLSGADLQTVLLDLPFASRLAGPGDVNCDGVPDLLLGRPKFGQDEGQVELVSGADGSVIWSDQGVPGDLLGLRLSATGDLNGDGAPDWLVGSMSYTRIYYADKPSVSTYCTGKVTSAGCTPFVDTSGQPSATGADDFLVLSREAMMQKPGLFFFGTTGPIGVPFLGGTLCVAPPLERTPVQISLGLADCQSGYAFHFTQALALSEGIAAGDTVNGQFWMRDPANVDGTGVALTDAVEFDWCQ